MKLNEKIRLLERRTKFSKRESLDPLIAISSNLNLNYDATKIQVVGTNGKGTTSKMITDVLKKTSSVGTFMSPYVYKFNERILINGKCISDHELENYLDWIEKIYLKFDLSFFEALTIMALKIFKDKNLKYIILEAGIGGRLDVTSIINYDFTLFTNVGHDHLNLLGPSLENVANEKIAAMKDNGYLITTVQNKYYSIIEKHLSTLKDTKKIFLSKKEVKIISNYPLTFIYKSEVYTLNYKGVHNINNALLAIELSRKLNVNEELIKDGLLNSKLVGRFETQKNLVYDGAHNIESIQALVKTVDQVFSRKKIYYIFSCLGDKNPLKMINALKRNGNVIATSFNDPRFIDFQHLIPDDVKYIKEFTNITNLLRNEKDAIFIFTGSFHFISYAKNLEVID